MIVQFKISLLDVGVPIWQKVQVYSRATFRELRKVIQVTFDRYDSHLHNFSIRKSNKKSHNHSHTEEEKNKHNKKKTFI